MKILTFTVRLEVPDSAENMPWVNPEDLRAIVARCLTGPIQLPGPIVPEVIAVGTASGIPGEGR